MPTEPNRAHAARAALVLVAVAAACIAFLHAALPDDPVRKMVSDYVHTPLGSVVLPLGLLAFGAALVLLARGLHTAGIGGRRVTVPLGIATVGLVLIAACHGDAAGTGTTLSGLVHKFGGGLLFGGLPVAGWALATRCSAHPTWHRLTIPVRRLATAGAVVLLLMLVGYLPEFGVPLPAAALFTGTHGLLERGVLVAEVAMVTLAAVRLVRPPLPARPVAVPAVAAPEPVRSTVDSTAA